MEKKNDRQEKEAMLEKQELNPVIPEMPANPFKSSGDGQTPPFNPEVDGKDEKEQAKKQKEVDEAK